MSQPAWKHIGNIGDKDPIAFGGGFVYIDETGVYAPELTWFEPGPDAEWHEKQGEIPLLVFRVILEPDPTNEWWYEKLADVARYAGESLESLQADSRSEDPIKRAWVYWSLIHYFAAEEFDSYPVTMTEDEAYERHADEMRAR